MHAILHSPLLSTGNPEMEVTQFLQGSSVHSMGVHRQWTNKEKVSFQKPLVGNSVLQGGIGNGFWLLGTS